MCRGTRNHSRLKLGSFFFSIRQNPSGRKLIFAPSLLRAMKRNPCPLFLFTFALMPTRATDAPFSTSTPSLSVSRHVFTYLRSFRYRTFAFAVHLILRPSSSSPSSSPPPPSPPSSFSVSSFSTSSFSTFHQRRRLVVLLSSFLVPLPLPSYASSSDPARSNNHHRNQ